MQPTRHTNVTMGYGADRRPPSEPVEVESQEMGRRVYLHALDEMGVPWVAMPPSLARVEAVRTPEGSELWLVAVFFWALGVPSPMLGKIRVTGWRADHDYLLVPQLREVHCEGAGDRIIVRIPTRLLT